MKKDKLLIILGLLIVAILVLMFILYGTKIFSVSNGNNNNQAKVTQGDVAMVMVQLKDAENELDKLQELAHNQEQAAKVELLLDEISNYQKEFQQPVQEITKQQTEDFYNSTLWQRVEDLKNEIGNNGQENTNLPELE